MINFQKYIRCREIDGKRYVYGDITIECDSDFYKKTVLPTSIIINALFGYVLPVCCLAALLYGKRKNLLHRISF